MGGFGVWDALQRWPDKFAAAIPVCGGGDPTYANRMKDVPVYIFHGLHVTYPDLAHGCWDEAFSTPGLFQWLFSKKK